MSNVIERMRRGDLITHTDPDYPLLWQEFEKTRSLVAELNGSYHTPDEITSLLSQIWGLSLVPRKPWPSGTLFLALESQGARERE